jgi:methyl-accepting chemotaxis protein
MQLTIRRKLIVSNVLNLCFAGAVGLSGYIAVQALDAAMDAVSVNGEALRMQMQADQLHDALHADVLGALMSGQAGDAQEQQRAVKETQQHVSEFRALLAQLDKQATDAAVRSAIANVQPDVEPYLKTAAEIAPLALTDLPAAQARFPEFMGRFRKLEASMAVLSERIEQNSNAARAVGDAAGNRGRLLMACAALLAVVAAAAVGLLTSRSITRPLDEAIEAAARIADGDLAAQIACADDDHTETGRLKLALRHMRDSLHGIVSRVRTGTDAIATASGQIASGNLDLSDRTAQQASALQETASAMQHLTTTVRHNGDNARQADQLAGTASEVARRGGDVVDRVVGTMSSIDASSKRIVDIIGVIEGIAFQTNILALNAAVEAARAGDQGRGFAVVAQEVRSLAQRSAVAAKEIKALIDESVAQVSMGDVLAGEAGATMREIVESVQRVTDIMSEISAASREQENGIVQINQAVREMDDVTQSNAALVEEAAAAATAMQDQAAALAQAVDVFRLSTAAQQGRMQPARQAKALAAPVRKAA